MKSVSPNARVDDHEIMKIENVPAQLATAGDRPDLQRRSDVAQSKTDASPAQTFVAELLEVLEHWRDTDDSAQSLYAKGAADAKKRIVEKLDDMLQYCGVVE